MKTYKRNKQWLYIKSMVNVRAHHAYVRELEDYQCNLCKSFNDFLERDLL